MGLPVKLYVYDVTRGMARGLSMALLGRQLDGVWHTGIVAYGNEYFYGGGGISYIPVGTFMLGPPDEIVDLGETEIPEDLFTEYVHDVAHLSFAGHKYHLLDHNCNTFSNEVALFLTGNAIPDKITNLPSEVMNTSFGQMMRPFLDNMMNQFNQGTHIDEEDASDHSTSRTGNGAAPAAAKNSTSQKKDAEAEVDRSKETAASSAPKKDADIKVDRSSASSAQKKPPKEDDFDLD